LIRNKLIHILFVPVILWTAFVWGTYFRVMPEITLTMIVYAGFQLYYFSLDPVAAFLYVPVLFGIQYSAHIFAESTLPMHPVILSIAIHAIGWVFLFTGHGVAEKRAPALLDSLFQSLVIAPFFVWLEVLFALGYRKSFQHEVEGAISKEIQKFRNTKAK